MPSQAIRSKTPQTWQAGKTLVPLIRHSEAMPGHKSIQCLREPPTGSSGDVFPGVTYVTSSCAMNHRHGFALDAH